MSNVEEKGSGILFAVFAIFLTLKLAGVITWSWWLVTLPLWISFAFAMSILAVCLSVIFIGWIFYLIYIAVWWVWDKLFLKN